MLDRWQVVVLKAVLFDVDDTLFDRNRAQLDVLSLIVRGFPDVFAGIDEGRITEAFLESDRVTAEAFGPDASPDTVRRERSKMFLDILGLGSACADRITAMYVELYPTIGAPIPGARPVLEYLVTRFDLGVVSNGLPDVQYRKLETLGITHLFKCIVLSGELGVWKPDPRIFWEAVDLLGHEPGECMYVGDSYEADVLGAKRAGLQTCWYNPAGVRPPSADVEHDYEICALDEVTEILDNRRRS